MKNNLYHRKVNSTLSVIIFQMILTSLPAQCPTGFPRNDTFISKPKNTFMENFRKEYPGCKIIIYMPTHYKLIITVGMQLPFRLRKM